MTVGQLRDRYADLFGEETPARNKQRLIKQRVKPRIPAIFVNERLVQKIRFPATVDGSASQLPAIRAVPGLLNSLLGKRG